jgi:hypothetical protein
MTASGLRYPNTLAAPHAERSSAIQCFESIRKCVRCFSKDLTYIPFWNGWVARLIWLKFFIRVRIPLPGSPYSVELFFWPSLYGCVFLGIEFYEYYALHMIVGISLIILMIIAATKASLVALFFMHAWYIANVLCNWLFSVFSGSESCWRLPSAITSAVLPCRFSTGCNIFG